MILARNDVSEDAIYALTADIFDNAADLVSSHAKYGELSLELDVYKRQVPDLSGYLHHGRSRQVHGQR